MDMDSNSTSVPPLQAYMKHVIFIFEGFIIILGNLLIIVTILLTKQLRRKEMFLILGLAVSDLLFGTGTFAAGIVRVRLVLTGASQVLVSAWECMQYFQPIFLFIGGQTSAIMMVVLSVDRLMAIVFFRLYMSLTKRYAFIVLGSVFAFAVVSTATAFLGSYFFTADEKIFPSMCILLWATPKLYGVFGIFLNTLGGFLSVLIYVMVVIAYRRHTRTTQQSSQGRSAQAAQLKRQRRLTHTLGIVTVCTFFFHSIPYCMILAMSVFKVKMFIFGMLAPYLGMIVRINSLVNIFIYIWRQKDMRTAMWWILKCGKTTNVVTSIGGNAGRAPARHNVSQFHTGNKRDSKTEGPAAQGGQLVELKG